MKIRLEATTGDLDHLADAIGEGRRTDNAGQVKVNRDALARLVIDHSRILSVVREDAFVDVAEPVPAEPAEIELVDDPALLNAMGD